MGHDSTPEGDAAACYGSAFLANGRDLWEEGDADAEEWAEFLRILKLEYGKGSFAVTDVHKLVRGEYPMDHIKDALPAGLHALVNKDGFAQAFGHALRQHADKRYGNAQWRVEKAGSDAHTKMTRWRVTYNEGSETP
jgi:hypothetical protein